jgi:hypothetical protein
MVNTTTNNCTSCLDPCSECLGTSSNCTACIDGFWKFEDGNICRQVVYWPFPYAIMGVISFVVILISEIVTKQESRFKEAFIAFLSIPEIMAWVNFIVFLYLRIGMELQTPLAIIALACYMIINFVHAIIHPRKMVPNSLFSYKALVTEHKCSTYYHRTVSYLISFKYSLILVSYFWLRPQYKGDYSAMNWIQFNRISIIFLFIPYPLMMASCCYFLVQDGFWSYAGFVACEVILISTVLAVLMLLDALSSIKCKTVGKKKSNRAVRVATGADYESDEDYRPSRRAMKH